MDIQPILDRIKKTVSELEPTAEVILYGSYARGDQHKESDLDILILVDKEHLDSEDKIRIQYPIYDIEIDTGIVISLLALPKKEWLSIHPVTPFFENVNEEGIVI